MDNLIYQMKERDTVVAQWDVFIRPDRYNANNTIYLELIDSNTQEPVTEITKCVPDNRVQLQPDYIVVKNYSENDGMDKWLETNGIALPTGFYINSGFVSMPVMQLTPAGVDHINEQFRKMGYHSYCIPATV